MKAVAAVVLAALFLAGCGGDSGSDGPRSSVEWPAPDDPAALAQEAGVALEPREYLEYHVHPQLDVFVDGAEVAVPAQIGIEPDAVGIDGTCSEPCISPLHTHDDSGLLHVEAPAPARFTLGQFFTQWDVKLDESCVGDFCRPDEQIAFHVDGEEYDGDPREIELTDGKQISVVIGDPPAEIPG